MAKHEHARKVSTGDQLLEQLGDVPVAYGFACELPAVDGEPLSELDQLWHDRFEHADRDWLFILNGNADHREIESLDTALEGGTAFVVCDETPLARVTPLGVKWYFDPDTGQEVAGEKEVRYWDDQLIEALHSRLTEKGKELPPLQEIVTESN